MLSEKAEAQRSGANSQSSQVRKRLRKDSNPQLTSLRPGPSHPHTRPRPPPRARPPPDTPLSRRLPAGRAGRGQVRAAGRKCRACCSHPGRPPPGIRPGWAMEAVPPLYRVAGTGPQGDDDRLGVPDGPGAPVSGDGSVTGGEDPERGGPRGWGCDAARGVGRRGGARGAGQRVRGGGDPGPSWCGCEAAPGPPAPV